MATPAARALLRTPLYAQHQLAKARMTDFGGWEMPVQYTGITAEHQAVRQQVGMFDISHMGKFSLQGQEVLAQLQKLVPSNLGVLKPGMAKYTVLLNESGGIIDDLIIYLQDQSVSGKQQVRVIVNAATTEQDKAWLLGHLDLSQLEFTDQSDQVLIALQGPQAVAMLQTLTDLDLGQIKNYGHQSGRLQLTAADQQSVNPAWFARTGYTGEDGFEVMVSPETGQHLWEQLINLGVAPCGLGARDTLRLEAAMALYGQDIDQTTTPLEAGLNWLIDWQQPEFIGRDALLAQKQQGTRRQLVGIEMQGRQIARHDYPVIYQDQVVGTVTSGTLSPTLGKAIALAFAPSELAQPGQELGVSVRGQTYPARVVPRPFYRRSK